MGNRSFLCLGTAEQISDGEGRPFADANNNFPTLWQLLLADGTEATANEFQRVFGDAGTPNISSHAETAMARVRKLAEGIRNHPLHDTVPGLDRQFAALLAWYRQEAAALGAPDGTGLHFSANLDELSWLDGDPPEVFLAKSIASCNRVAAAVDAALDGQAFPALDRALELDAYGDGFSDWSAWAWSFGFGGLDHPYFNALGGHGPRDEAFEDFIVEVRDERDDDDSWLGDGLQRFRENGRVGVTRTTSEFSERGRTPATTVLIPAEWDAIDTAGHGKLALFWVRRDGRVGLLRADNTGTALLCPCTLDEAWGFERAKDLWVAAALVGDDIGLLGDDGRWRAAPDAITPRVQELWSFSGRWCAARSGEQVGVIDSAGQWTVAPGHDGVDSIRATGIGIAQSGETRRLIDVRSGKALTDPLDVLVWQDWPGVFVGARKAAGTMGWWNEDGSVKIAAAWDDITMRTETPQRIAVSRDGRVGLVDAAGKELVPPRYDGVEMFTPMSHDRGSPAARGEIACISTGDETSGKRGVWSVAEGRELVPCIYDFLYPMPLFHAEGNTTHGFLAANLAPGHTATNPLPLYVGVLRADGSALHPLTHAWIGARYDSTTTLDAMQQGRALFDVWSRNEPVQAALTDEDHYVWLTRDGTRTDDREVRERQFAAGDFAAAYALACQYRDGDGVPQDAALVERWMLLAAGQPASVFDPPAQGFFRRLLGAKPASPLLPSNPDPRGDVRAICALCHQLVSTLDPERRAAARAWLELVNADAGRASAEAQMLLGFLLFDESRGAADDARAFEYATRAVARGNTVASFNLGLMHEYGRGTAASLAEARKHYTVASKAGDTAADFGLGRVLMAEAMAVSPPNAKTLMKQAAYHLQQAMESDTATTVRGARTLLAQLHWDGLGVKQQRERAVALLRESAEDGDGDAIRFLAETVYGSDTSPYHSPGDAAHWRSQLEE